MCYIFNNLFYSAGLRHLFASKFLPLMGKLCIEELDIAFIHAVHIKQVHQKKIALTAC